MNESVIISPFANQTIEKLKGTIRDVPDFPSPGILFKDLAPVFLDIPLCKDLIRVLVEAYSDNRPDCIAAIESRGFFFGFALAIELGVPFVPVRKKGKLPGEVVSVAYELEYGTAEIEVQKGAIKPGMKVLVHDDLLATGGTALAAAHLVQRNNAEVIGFSFLVGLSGLNGKPRLEKFSENVLILADYN